MHFHDNLNPRQLTSCFRTSQIQFLLYFLLPLFLIHYLAHQHTRIQYLTFPSPQQIAYRRIVSNFLQLRTWSFFFFIWIVLPTLFRTSILLLYIFWHLFICNIFIYWFFLFFLWTWPLYAIAQTVGTVVKFRKYLWFGRMFLVWFAFTLGFCTFIYFLCFAEIYYVFELYLCWVLLDFPKASW